MIKNDSLDKYIFIRHKLFRKSLNERPDGISQLQSWKKSTISNDYGKDAWKKIKVIKSPKELDSDLKDLYIKYLEGKIYKWHQLM